MNRNEFNKILPKIKFNDSKIPTKTDLFKSRELFIDDSKLTNKFINYIRHKDLSEEIFDKNKTFEGIEPDLSFTKGRSQQLNMSSFYELCLQEKLISNREFFNKTDTPLISVLIIAYNKKDIILKSIRSVQNQSLKNIEIIIVNDHSTDNSEEIFQELLKEDERVRIFTHLNNMGAWRSRLDGFLYSNAPYVIHFDAGDFYADNYVLEDFYNLVNNYKLDSVRFGFRLTRSKTQLTNMDEIYLFNEIDRKIVYGRRIYDISGFIYGTIWNRLTRASVFTKGLLLLDEYILNAYKNMFEDRWWNTMANNESNSFLMANRIGYIYIKDPNGEGNIKTGNTFLNEKTIKEIILFFLFDYNLSYIKSNKSDIINNLRDYRKGQLNIKLSDLKSPFPPYNHLLNILINDKYVSKQDKLFLLTLKNETKFYR